MTDEPDIERRTLLRGIAAVSGTALSSALLSRRAVAQPTHVKKGQTPSQNSTNVILTHGAWADGSSWAKVILPLERHGLEVVAAPIPLTSFSDDIAALERAIERTNGPVILAAHAYAGAVISAVKNERVKSLVYVAALTPDQGETVGDMFYRGKPHPKAPHLAPDTNGLIWMPKASFGEAFAQNAPSDMIAILASTQRPIALRCIQEIAPEPAWKTKPSWFLVAEQDRMINPETQHFHGQTHGREDTLARGRSHVAGYRARGGSRNNPRGRNQPGVKSEYLNAPEAPSSSSLLSPQDLRANPAPCGRETAHSRCNLTGEETSKWPCFQE